jgi:5'-methylthioadenosine phosphorylase
VNSSGPNSTQKQRIERLGIIGGSGLCEFPELEPFKVISRPATKYGPASGDIVLAKRGAMEIAFIARHGKAHDIPPHRVPYKANLTALKELGVTNVIGTCIVGSLKREIVPGSIVIPDQFINLTWGRDDTFEADERKFVHLPMGEPYCASMRQLVISAARHTGGPMFSQGTVAVIQGPRFSTAAESRWFSGFGWDIVNMTQYPECYFAKELGICYSALATVTDYDVGLKESVTISSEGMGHVLEVFKRNIVLTKRIVLLIADGKAFRCGCASVRFDAYYEKK